MIGKNLKLTFLFLFITLPVSACHVNDEVKERTNDHRSSLNTIQLISRSLSKGEINRNEAALYKAYAIFDREKLPSRFRSSVPQKDATMIIRQLKKEYESLDKDTKEKIKPYLFRKKGGS